jgi:hypothetical protein
MQTLFHAMAPVQKGTLQVLKPAACEKRNQTGPSMAAAAVHGRRRRLLLLLAALLHLLLVVPPPVQAARVTALIVFGDSTVDAGNNNVIPTVARSNFPPYGRNFPPEGRASGRFSDGRLATDFYSEALGLGRAFVPAYLDPHYGIRDFAIGVCFASAGSGLDVATSRVLVSASQNLLSVLEYLSHIVYF